MGFLTILGLCVVYVAFIYVVSKFCAFNNPKVPVRPENKALRTSSIDDKD